MEMCWRRFVAGAVLALMWLVPQRAIFAQGAESQIKQVLTDPAGASDRGDIESFMQGYADSPETTFIGKTVRHGWREIMDRYKTSYATKDAMGTVAFSDLAVRMLGTNYAVVTGQYNLTRGAAGGGDASGVFSLVLEKTAKGWKIILDHTS